MLICCLFSDNNERVYFFARWYVMPSPRRFSQGRVGSSSPADWDDDGGGGTRTTPSSSDSGREAVLLDEPDDFVTFFVFEFRDRTTLPLTFPGSGDAEGGAKAGKAPAS